MTPHDPVAARDAAAVILARDTASAPEVLLLERHADSRSSPGAFAFPGGRVEADDALPELERVCRGLTAAEAARVIPDVRPAARALGFWIAALRELFEETGLLLAHGPAGNPVAAEGAVRERLGEDRARSRRAAGAFLAMLAREGLTLATDRMAYCAHWITPEERLVRYDTRFFLAASPVPDATPEPDGTEVVGWRWLQPAAALAQHAAGVITLPLPTQRILGSIAGHADVAALLAAARRREVRPVRPRIVRAGERERILLPDDPGYF